MGNNICYAEPKEEVKLIELDEFALKELAHFEEVMKLVKLKPDDREDIKTLFVNKHKYMQDKMLLRFKTTLRLFGIVAAHPVEN